MTSKRLPAPNKITQQWPVWLLWRDWNLLGAIHVLYNAREGEGVLQFVIYVMWGMEGCISYCYITHPEFFHRDPTSWAIHECGENKENGLLTMMLILFVDLLEVFIAWTGRETVFCYSVMLCCFIDYIEYLYLRCRISSFCGMFAPTVWEGSGFGHCYIISRGRVGKTVI